MSIRNSRTEKVACMYDSTTGRAFGPVFNEAWELDEFLTWYAVLRSRRRRRPPRPALAIRARG